MNVANVIRALKAASALPWDWSLTAVWVKAWPVQRPWGRSTKVLSMRENVRSLSDRLPLHRLSQSPAFGSALDTCCHSAAGSAQAPPRLASAHVLSLPRPHTCAVTQPGPVPAEGAAPAARHSARRLQPAHGRRSPPRPRAAGPGKAGRRAGAAGPRAKHRVSEWGTPASGLLDHWLWVPVGGCELRGPG